VVEVEVKGGGISVLSHLHRQAPGVTHGDCELVSQQVGTILDVEDVVPGGRYNARSSSPGWNESSSNPGTRGSRARKPDYSPRTRDGGALGGTLGGLDDGAIALETEAGETMRFPLDQIRRPI